MKNKILFLILIIITNIYIVNAEEDILDLASNSESAILIDFQTGKVLYEKNSKEILAPASMTKIASMLVVMEAIEKGAISLTDSVLISPNAASMGGSQVYLEAGETYTVDQLLKAVAIASGNDAVVALAEKVAGTEESFVKLMNEKCKDVGCENTNFVNAHGLDAVDHYSSAYDMSLLAKELIKYESILDYTSVYEDYLTRNDGSQTWLVNTNKLLRYYVGVDGLKTGYTKSAGYCLTATINKNDFRLISVVMNSTSSEKRSADTISLFEYGYSNYSSFIIKSKDESIGTVDVNNGKVKEVELYLKDAATDLKNILDTNKTYEVIYDIKELEAPIEKGQIVGLAKVIDNESNIIEEIDIIVKEEVKKASFKDYLIYNFQIILNGKNL